MPRALWKGAISFGLVHVPVSLYPASHEDTIDFDWLDKRSMDPVGYKRFNKRTGKEVERDDIVKGIQRGEGDYVVLSDDEIKNAYPRSTRTIAIEAFVSAGEIPFVHLDRPYYLAPAGKSAEKVYALLREALLDAGRVGIARVVIQTREHLAALIPAGPALMLNTLRWASEIRPWNELELPPEGKKASGLTGAELKMAAKLIGDMTAAWDPAQYADRFRDAVMALVEQKEKAGDTQPVTPLEAAADDGDAVSNVIDLTDLLKRSLGRGKPTTASARTGRAASRKTADKTADKTAARKPAARKRA